MPDRSGQATSKAPTAARIAFGIVVGAIAVAWVDRVSVSALEHGTESDIVRQWVVTQYVRRGEDPYAIAGEVLRSRLGDATRRSPAVGHPDRSFDPIEPRVLPEIGAPEATYPPGAVGLLTITVGWLVSPVQVLWVWLVVNLVSAAAVVHFLGKTFDQPPRQLPVPGRLAALILMMVLLPAYYAIANGQFSFLVLACLLVGLQPGVKEGVAGLASGLALMKPSIALPFLFLDLVKGKWKRLAVAAGVQLVATLGVGLAIHRSPFQLVREWMGVSEYFLSGMFTLQELINYFGFRGTPYASAITMTALAFLVSVVVVFRHRPTVELFGFLCVGSVLWMYHKYYDFIMVMPALLIMMGWSSSSIPRREPGQPSLFRRSLSLGQTFAMVLAISLIPYVNYADGFLPRLLRWGGRAALVALLGVMVLRVERERKRDLAGRALEA